MPPWSLDPQAWSWKQRLAVLSQKTQGYLASIVLPVPAKGQRKKPRRNLAKPDRCRPSTEAEMVTVLISAELDQHTAQSGLDGVGEHHRITLEDEPGINAEP